MVKPGYLDGARGAEERKCELYMDTQWVLERRMRRRNSLSNRVLKNSVRRTEVFIRAVRMPRHLARWVPVPNPAEITCVASLVIVIADNPGCSYLGHTTALRI